MRSLLYDNERILMARFMEVLTEKGILSNIDLENILGEGWTVKDGVEDGLVE